MRELSSKKIRNWIMYPYFITYFLVVAGSDLNFSLGLPLVISGFLLRVFAAGYISKSKALCTSGPYAFIRHPLYSGSFLIGLGLSAVSNNFYLMAFFVIVFMISHYGTISHEEKYLDNKFSAEFEYYQNRVPAFFPNFTPFKSRHPQKFSFHLMIQNGELVRVIGISLLVFFLFFIEEFTYRKANLGVRQFILILGFTLLLGLLFVNLNIRKRFNKINSKVNQKIEKGAA